MNGLQIFQYAGQEIHTIQENGEPLFALKDVCLILELGQVAGVKRRLEDDVISNHPIEDRLGRTQQATFINEDGLYDVILDSRKQEAKQFRKWITSNVLPQIRKTGSYKIDDKPKTPAEMFLENAQMMVNFESRINRVEKQQENISELVSLNTIDWRNKVNSILSKISEERGGDMNHKNTRNESYQLLERRAGCKLEIRLTNKRKKMALEGAARSRINKANKMDVIADDRKLTEIYLAVVKDMGIRNQVDTSEIPNLLEAGN